MEDGRVLVPHHQKNNIEYSVLKIEDFFEEN
jgi:hypothetical protein